MTQIAYPYEINLPLVKELVAEQFPAWASLPIESVLLSGHDNRTFRLGSEMSIRLPSAQEYAAKVQIEQRWLPFLANYLSLRIPKPLALGQPSPRYPYHWSIYRWIEGESANVIFIDEKHLSLMAVSLAQFLNELHKIDVTGGPLAGPHNFYRGGQLAVYDAETRAAIVQLRGVIDVNLVTEVWQKALSSQWIKDPVWIHGDLSAGNIIVKDNQLVAIIDFGGMGIGDPACDLVIAWTFLTHESRTIFKQIVSLDLQTWARARGWALWKALITLASLNDKQSPEAFKQQQIINTLLIEHTLES